MIDKVLNWMGLGSPKTKGDLVVGQITQLEPSEWPGIPDGPIVSSIARRSKKCKHSTWKQILAAREQLAQKLTPPELASGFRAEVSTAFEGIRVSGDEMKVVWSRLTACFGQELFLQIFEQGSACVKLNYDEALALYRGLKGLFDEAECDGCAERALGEGPESDLRRTYLPAPAEASFHRLQVWCPRCKEEVTLMGKTPRCPRCECVFTRAPEKTFLVLPERHSSASAVPKSEEKKEE